MTTLATRTIRTLSDLDHNLSQHLEQLGFISLASYLLWCRKNGFAVTEYRGKYNHRPFDKKRTAKRHWQERPYLYFLQQSPRILRQWMQREGLAHA